MGSKQDDHNRGERDGAKASGFDAWVDLNNPLNPEEYKAGYRHGLQQQRNASIAADRAGSGRTSTREERPESPVSLSVGHGGGGSGGGVGGGGGGGVPVIRGLVLIFVIGIVLYVSEDYRRHHPEHVEVDIAVLDAECHRPIRFLGYTPGASQRINFSITWKGGLQYKKKPFVLSLLRNSKTVFTRQIESDDKGPLGFYVPYDSELQRGRYVARVLVEGVGTRDYDFTVGTEKDILDGINLGDPPVEAEAAAGVRAYVTDSFVGPLPWPPRNVIYAVRGEPKWLYAVVEADSSPPDSVDVALMCGTVMIAREALRVSPGSRGWLYVHQELSAGHCGEIILVHANQKITFPFIVVEVDREKNGYKTVGDPDAAGHDLSSSWLQSGIAHSKAGQHEEAIRDFSGIATEDTDPDGAAHNLRGDEYLALGDYQRAIADYDYVLRWRPHDRWARNNRAAAYANLHDYPRAIADFQYEIRINPNDEYAIETLAKARRDMAAQSASNLTCYIGSWHDNIGEPWIFSQRGELLHLYRPLDGSEGTLNWTGNEWRGSVSLPHMHWNAEIMLRSSDDSCTRLNTDSAMYFVRVPANGG